LEDDAGEPMGTVVFGPQNQSHVATSQDLPAKQRLSPRRLKRKGKAATWLSAIRK
jgi:hypothetical protein